MLGVWPSESWLLIACMRTSLLIREGVRRIKSPNLLNNSVQISKHSSWRWASPLSIPFYRWGYKVLTIFWAASSLLSEIIPRMVSAKMSSVSREPVTINCESVVRIRMRLASRIRGATLWMQRTAFDLTSTLLLSRWSTNAVQIRFSSDSSRGSYAVRITLHKSCAPVYLMSGS